MHVRTEIMQWQTTSAMVLQRIKGMLENPHLPIGGKTDGAFVRESTRLASPPNHARTDVLSP